MKTSNIISAALIALGIVSQAKADPTVYLTGSTAFRSTVYNALVSGAGTNGGGVFDSTPSWETYGNGTPGSGTYMIFHGNIAGSPVYIDCAWSGSEAGIASASGVTLTNVDRNGNSILLNGSPETWLNVSNITLGNGAISTNPSSSSGLFETATRTADLTQADTSQAISWTPFVPNSQTALTDYGVEAIVTFTVSRNFQPSPVHEWSDVTNVTLPELNILAANGWAPAGFLSGNTNDNDFDVVLVGRNLGSGTRMNFLGDSQYGAHKTVNQWSIGEGIEEPTHLDSLILTNEGNNGYESGGDVAKALGIYNVTGNSGSCQQAIPSTSYFVTNSIQSLGACNGWLALGYVAPSDALSTGNGTSATGFGGGGGVIACPTNDWVQLDGVLSSDGTIENGQWWLWGHEHLYGKFQNSGTPDAVGNLLANAVTFQVTTVLGYGTNAAAHDPGIPVGLMNVTKGSDVSYPTF